MGDWTWCTTTVETPPRTPSSLTLPPAMTAGASVIGRVDARGAVSSAADDKITQASLEWLTVRCASRRWIRMVHQRE
jgi:hypothetical protein